MLVGMNQFASRNSTAKFAPNFEGRAYRPYWEIYSVMFVMSWGFSFRFMAGNQQGSYIGIIIYMYRIFLDFV
jgi:hypothetical protein